MTTTDPLLTPEDANLLLALAAAERDECGGCGHPMSESADPATQQTWSVHRRTCEACRVLEAEIQNDSEGGTRPRGVKYQVTRTGADHG